MEIFIFASFELSGDIFSPALTLSSAPLLSGDAALPGGIRETVLGHLRQIKADLAGEPLVAEQIYRILNATMEA